MKLIIYGQGEDGLHYGDGVYGLITEYGELLATHFCSSKFFAQSDLHDRRQERIETWKVKFPEGYEVVFLDKSGFTMDQLVEANKKWWGENKDKADPIPSPSIQVTVSE